jgi:regulator of cell morphogenesis and NO signaling
MNQITLSEESVGEIVVNDFRTSAIFKEAGIDFCCGGQQTLLQACKEKGINLDELEGQINELNDDDLSQSLNYKEWDLPFLIDYIVNTHHKYVVKTLPDLVFYTQKIASVHGEHHPELVDIAHKIVAINTELTSHLKREEKVLFPAIKDIIQNSSKKSKDIIQSEISRMLSEHDFAGRTMDEINVITDGYEVPDDGRNTYKVTLKLLRQFEDDLHIHVHLENNILFSKALKMTV